MFKKRLLTLSLSMVFAVSLFSACGKTNTGSTTGSKEPTTNGTTETTGTTAGPADSGKTEDLKVMIYDRGTAAPGTTQEESPYVDWIREQVMENCNVAVSYMSVPRSGSDDKLNVMMAGGGAPDIVFSYAQSMFLNYATSGGLTDLTEAYANYGSKIKEESGGIQYMGEIDGSQYAILKQRQGSISRHVQYIRTDWLEKLGMDIPKTKEELFKVLYAFKEQNPGNVKNVIPWAMGGEVRAERYYANFVGSYVDNLDEREAYIYSSELIVFADGAVEGIRKLNELYNDGIIGSEFVTDTTGDLFKQEITSGNVGFILGDTTGPLYDLIPVLQTNVEGAVYTPLSCFELSDGTYRNPAEPPYGMFIMVPKTSESKANAAIKYLNWMVDPVVAENIQFTPAHVRTERGTPIWLSDDESIEHGYPKNSADYNIMNERFEYAKTKEGIVTANAENYDWADEEWFSNAYDIHYINGHYLFPTFPVVGEAETEYGINVKTLATEYVNKLICASPADFDSLQKSEYAKLVSAGLEKILEERAEYYDNK